MEDSEITKLGVGDVVLFSGYTGFSEDDDSTDKLIEDGAKCRVIEINLDTKGVTVQALSGGRSDTVFPDEIEMVPTKAEAKAKKDPETQTKGTKANGKDTSAQTLVDGQKEADEAEVPGDAETVAEQQGSGQIDADVVAESAIDIPAEEPTENPTEEVPTNQADDLEVPIPAAGFVDSESVNAEISGLSGDAVEAAKRVARRAQDADFVLGGILHNVHRNKLHEAMGYDHKNGFREFCEAEIGVGYRKAAYLIKIYTWARGLNIDEAELGDIGWTKVRQLASANVTQEELPAMVAFAREHSKSELEGHIKASRVSAGATETVLRKTFKFTLFADEADIVERALNTALDLCGGDDLSKAFAYIAADWAMTNEGVTMTEKQIIDHASAKSGKQVIILED